MTLGVGYVAMPWVTLFTYGETDVRQSAAHDFRSGVRGHALGHFIQGVCEHVA